MQRKYLDRIIDNLRKNIDKDIKRGNYGEALNLIATLAEVFYESNIKYTDEKLESQIEYISSKILIEQGGSEATRAEGLRNAEIIEAGSFDESVVLFWDAFGFDERGLVQIYLKAIFKFAKVVYVTYSAWENKIPKLKSFLKDNGAKVCFLDGNKKDSVSQIYALNDIIRKYKPGHMVLYGFPYDTTATPLFYAYEGKIRRYLVNLTDHSFWLGAGCIDKCLEFREYGACISNKYRGIDRDKIFHLPMYPSVDYEQEFEGFPFEKQPDTKVIFSGGSLYKTFGGGNKYYEMVEYILSHYEKVIFWYAGSGDDSELKKLIEKFPGRLAYTKERRDLFQVLNSVDVYLSTYPVCGGLMFQYSALAGRVPLTLYSNDVSDGFLLKQEELGIFFDTPDELYKELDKLLKDEEYKTSRGEALKKSVASCEAFEKEVRHAFTGLGETKFPIRYKDVNTDDFRAGMLEEYNNTKYNKSLLYRNSKKTIMKVEPFRMLSIIIDKAKKKI